MGVEPGRIAEAALAVVSKGEVLPNRTFLGVPVSVGRVVDLPRVLTDREWTNGNLHVFLEPTATGDRLRLRTRKGSAMAVFAMGAAGLVIGLALMTLFVLEDLGRASLVFPTLRGSRHWRHPRASA